MERRSGVACTGPRRGTRRRPRRRRRLRRARPSLSRTDRSATTTATGRSWVPSATPRTRTKRARPRSKGPSLLTKCASWDLPEWPSWSPSTWPRTRPRHGRPERPHQGHSDQGTPGLPSVHPGGQDFQGREGRTDGKFQTGVLVRNAKGEHVFFPDGGAKCDDKGQPINVAAPGADGKVQDAVGDKLRIAGIVDVNENGMPEFRPVDEKNPAPQDKMATVGVLTKDANGVTVFLQTKGQTVGSGDAAPPIAATQEGPQPAGKVMGHVVLKNGKLEVVPVGQANGAEVVGIIAMGNMNQPVMIVKKGGSLDKPGAVNYDDDAIKKYTDADWKPLVVNNETMQKEAAPAIQNNNIAIIASQTGKSPDELRKEMENREVASCSFVQGPYDPYRSVFAYQKTAGQTAIATKAAAAAASRAAEAAAAGGAAGAGGSGAGAGGAGGNAGGAADVRSVAFGYGGGAYAPKSVFFSPSAAAAAKNEAAKGNPKSVFATGTPSAGKDATSCYFASK